MKTVRAKFKVSSLTQTEHGETIKLEPVRDGSEENKEFFKWTPAGQIEIGTVNSEAAKEFEVGKEFYVDFTPVKIAELP